MTQRLSHAPRALREAPSRMTARATRPPTSSIRPRSPLASELFTVLPALDGKPWLRVLEILEQPPTVFQVHGRTERCVELSVFGRTSWVRIAWEADLDGTRAELVDQCIDLARLRAHERDSVRVLEDHARTERRSRTSRIAYEMELRAARAIASEALDRQKDAERLTADAERRRIARDQILAASALFASVAHDIRSPLTALVLNLRVLEEDARRSGQLSSATQSMFDDTRLACDLIEGVLDGLRTYASCSGVPRRLAVRPIVECAVRLFRWHMQQKGVALAVEVHGEPEAWGTTSEICQILLNLLANAKEAHNRPDDLVEVTTTMPMDGRIAILIDDRGPGFPAAAGTPLYTTKDPCHHGGLGLFVSRELATRRGGELGWEPRPGGGSRVRLVLPITARG